MLLINNKLVDLGRVVDFCNPDLISYNLLPRPSHGSHASKIKELKARLYRMKTLTIQ